MLVLCFPYKGLGKPVPTTSGCHKMVSSSCIQTPISFQREEQRTCYNPKLWLAFPYKPKEETTRFLCLLAFAKQNQVKQKRKPHGRHKIDRYTQITNLTHEISSHRMEIKVFRCSSGPERGLSKSVRPSSRVSAPPIILSTEQSGQRCLSDHLNTGLLRNKLGWLWQTFISAFIFWYIPFVLFCQIL